MFVMVHCKSNSYDALQGSLVVYSLQLLVSPVYYAHLHVYTLNTKTHSSCATQSLIPKTHSSLATQSLIPMHQ